MRQREKEEREREKKERERERREWQAEKEERERERELERHERAREREERHREREEREQERQREREERERWCRKWVDERPRGRQGKEKKRENGGGSLVERALEDMLDNKSFKVGGSKLGASFLGEATLSVVKKVIVETVTKTKVTKLHCMMKVSEVLKWLCLVNQLCEGDMETYRTLVFSQAAGEKAFLVREELQAQPQNKEPLNAVLKGMFGVKWRKALRKEWRDMAGRTDGRELWAEVQMVGSTLGEMLEQQKRKFFEVLLEEVQAQLVSWYLGEEAVLKLDWKDKMLLEVAFLWKSGKPTLSVLEQPPLGLPRPAAGQPPAHFHQQMSFQPPANFHPFGQFYPHGPYQPNGAFQQWRGGQGAFWGNPCENFHAGGNQGPPAAGGVVGGNQAPPANGGANERNQAPPATGGASARNQAPPATGGAATGDQAPQGGKGNAGVSGDHPLCTFCKSRQHRTENCILNPQSRGYMHHMWHEGPSSKTVQQHVLADE